MSAQSEAAAARAAAGLFRRPECGVLEVSGKDRVRWLDGMLTNAVTSLAAGPDASGCQALVLTRTGRIVANPHVLVHEDTFWLDVLRDGLEAMRETLNRFIVADRVELRDASAEWERLALEGPAAPAILEETLGTACELAPDCCASVPLAGTRVVVVAAGYTAAGRQLHVPAGCGERVAEALLRAGASRALLEAGPEALEVLRIEAGVPKLGVELDESVLPAEANLEHAISFTKGCYTGQEIVARLESRGKPGHRLVGLTFESGVLAQVDAELSNGARAVGEVTSVCESPVAGAIGLGFVRSASAEPGTSLQVGGASARVTALPFLA